ncbi:MAG: hypothetical protein Q4G52_10365 [Clostridia bacterium]|nr:hypothetical protein [Clostridia bacterium]
MPNDAQYAIETQQRSLFDRDLRPHADVGDVYGKVMANIEFLERSEMVSRDNEWNVPLNDFQTEMIDRYGLSGTKLPGLLYNRATTKQRMLCAIFATPQDVRGIDRLTLTEQLEALKAGKLAVVTEADYNYILSQAAIVEGSETDESGLPLSREGQQAYGRMRDAQANVEPASLSDKLGAWRYMNLLSSPVTTIKNLSGNLLMQQADRISKNRLTEFVDKLAQKKTGTRTIARVTREEAQAGTEAAIQRGRDAFDDYFVAGTSTSRSRNYDVGGDGRVFQSPALELGRNLINFCMDAGDQVFMEKAIVEEMGALERIRAKIRDEETGEMREMSEGERYQEAYARAAQRFYHDDNAMSRVMNGVYNVPIVGKVARVLIPFVKTPSNVALRMFDYSPLGLAKSIFYDGLYEMNANKGADGVGVGFDQEKFVMGVGRGMTGTGVTLAGILLYGAGLIRFGREEEENDRRRGVLGTLGEPYSLYVQIGETKHELAFTLPVTAGLSIGAGIASKLENGDEAMNIVTGILGEQFNQIFDNTYLSSLNDIFRGYDDGAGIAERLVGTTVKSYAQQMFSPSILRAIAKATDPYQRDTQSANSFRQAMAETVVQNWPGLRQTLPIKTDLTGEPMTQHKAYGPGGAWESAVIHFVDSLLTPTATYSDKDDAALCELLDLSYRTGETSFLPTQLASKNELKVTKTLAQKMGDEMGGYTLMLTDEERREANRMYGDILFNGTRGIRYPGPSGEGYEPITGLRGLMESGGWERMSDAERIKAIEETAKTVKELVIVQAVSWAEE